MLDIEVEIERLPGEMSASIEQNQVVGTGSPHEPRSAKILGSMDLYAVIPEDASADIASTLVGIDEENSPAIEI